MSDYDINQYFRDGGYILKKDINLFFSEDSTGLWQATIEGVDVYAYGENQSMAYDNLIDAIYLQVRRYRTYDATKVGGKIVDKINFIKEHLEE